MNSEEFVKALERYVRDAAIEDVISILKRPAGKRPALSLIEQSNWYNSLSDQEAERVNEVIRFAANAAVIGFLSVLDGARIIDDRKGRFELFYQGNEKMLLNPPTVDLHDLFQTDP